MSTPLPVMRRKHELEMVLSAIELDPHLQPSTRQQYQRALANYVNAGHSLTDPDALTRYAATVGSSTRAFLSAGVRRFAKQVEQAAKSSATPANVAAVQATVYRAEALRDAVRVHGHGDGHRAHTWLSQTEVKQLLDECATRNSGNAEASLVAQRDRLALALLVGAGLRRSEAVALRFADVQLQPLRDKLRAVLNVHGKGAKDRVIPISDRLASLIDQWAAVVGNAGLILRSLGRNRLPGDSISTTALYNIVQKRGAQLGREGLEPHDLRRTYAQLGYEAGISILQISVLLGHSSVETTQRYLNLELDLATTVSDFIPV